MAKKRVDKVSLLRRISIGRVISLTFTIIMIFILFSFLGLLFTVFFGVIPTGNIAVIPIEGTITAGSAGYGGGASSSEIVKLIQRADENSEIKAILLEINSGGGSAVASDEIAEAVKRAEKPTVAVIREAGASGAYWIASATDKIYANRMSITGSIGVIASYLEFANLLEDYNITYRRIVSGKYKDMGSPLKEMTMEEEMILKDSISQIHDFFVQAVAENRNMPEESVKKIASGRFMLGVEAKEVGLVDELGSKTDAVEYIEEMLNITADLAHYTSKASLYDLFSARISNPLSGLASGDRQISLQT